MNFSEFDLNPKIKSGIKACGYTKPTAIQEQAIPHALRGLDIMGLAQTGTGKTAAFLVVAFQRLLQSELAAAELASTPEASSGERPAHPAHPALHDAPEDRRMAVPHKPPRWPGPRALILAPTRELAVQIHKDAQLLAAKTGFRLGLVYGGTGYQAQRDEVAAGVDLLIGTPGRLIDYLKQRVFDLRHVKVVVLDEADRMFDLGFIKDIRFVLRRLPPPSARLGMLFSATLSYRVMELAYEHMNDPRMVEITPERVTADRVTQRGYMVANDEKIPLLIGLLRQIEGARSMVFVNTKREGERVWGYLQGNGLKAAMLSGDVPQKKRLSLLRQFQEGELATMVATDVAARGLHIPGVTHVINYDLPDDAEDYVHRIGRTARAGAAGDAISFVCESYAMGWPDIEAFVGARIPISTVEPDLLAEVDPKSRIRVERRPRDSGREGGRGSGARGRGGPRRERQAEAKEATAGAGSSAPPASAGSTGLAGGGPNAGDGPKKRRRRRSTDRSEPAPQT